MCTPTCGFTPTVMEKGEGEAEPGGGVRCLRQRKGSLAGDKLELGGWLWRGPWAGAAVPVGDVGESWLPGWA